ncbi:MAG: UDP-N-acetylglucosamine--N-acetylmuramyl-(pentapeptide) pyrophosphoryl-undecaprenol N-acetylglucosamine transferase [Candidatus Doudnabacteria bacterium]|nr:UDP-N-acetylglucosamine--N-acetylmuramyl-(pentapeptide) pyrophosphoryl-undecaprenol N-acetylglucosamine transferase [Candidatus Doudnabacteria bacterium]
MKILLVGGGSGGPVTPVLAVAQELKKLKPRTEFLFVGTRQGPERSMVSDFGIPFKSIAAAKFRRYFSLRNFLDIFIFLFSLLQALFVVRKFRPDAVFAAGSYVSVPVAWMAKLLGAKVIIHQQDVSIGLANKLISPFADQITTALAYTAKKFYSGSGLFTKKWKAGAEWVGNPFRQELLSSQKPDRKIFGLNDKLPVLLILGGATGAVQINSVVEACLDELLKAHQVIHQTGKGKKANFIHPDYHQYELLPFDKYVSALKLADIVIARAGLSTLTELSMLGKIAIIVPMPDSHQMINAQVIKGASAAVVLSFDEFNPVDLPRIVTSLKFNVSRQRMLIENITGLMPKDAGSRIAKLIIKQVNAR